MGLQKEVKPSVRVLTIFLGRAHEYIIMIQEWAGGLVIRVAFGVFGGELAPFSAHFPHKFFSVSEGAVFCFSGAVEGALAFGPGSLS